MKDAQATPAKRNSAHTDTVLPEHHSETTIQSEQIMKERNEYLNGWKRALADFENFKRGAQKTMHEAQKIERIKLLREILPIIDTIEQALIHVPSEHRSAGWFQGLSQVQSQWQKFMNEHRIEKIHMTGAAFDPTRHEAIHTENRSDAKDHTVLAVVSPGYVLDSDLVRPAKVTVNMRST